eukprot:TRINITY_DN3258_c0_g1_i4.p1 TRINITY_DN3258_c0_g1~~TRINITY_DN3258_c0_g1_i4.p1  ORF type:complete len:431 (-),score=76.59 TRINITY_DN3258_c0_g1_i4:50-1342(-)
MNRNNQSQKGIFLVKRKSPHRFKKDDATNDIKPQSSSSFKKAAFWGTMVLLIAVGIYYIQKIQIENKERILSKEMREFKEMGPENRKWTQEESKRIYLPYKDLVEKIDELGRGRDFNAYLQECKKLGDLPSLFNETFNLFSEKEKKCFDIELVSKIVNDTMGPKFSTLLKDFSSKKEKMSSEQRYNYIQHTLNDAIFYSEAIEETSLSLVEARQLLEKGSLSFLSKEIKGRDIISILNHKIAMKMINKGSHNLSHEILWEAHKQLLAGRVSPPNVALGEYRMGKVYVNGKVVFPHECEVHLLMEEYIKWYNKCLWFNDFRLNRLRTFDGSDKQLLKTNLVAITFAIESMVKFVQIHPFGDGNGRMSRILMNLTMLRSGLLPIEMIDSIDFWGITSFYETLRLAFNGDKERLLTMMIKLIGDSLSKHKLSQ